MNKSGNIILNDSIKASVVLLISEDGESKGEVNIDEAREIASQSGLDLWQVNHKSVPTCKLIDYGKFMYNKSKKQKNNKNVNQHKHTKEVRVSYKISQHDVEFKHKNILKFLKKGIKVYILCV